MTTCQLYNIYTLYTVYIFCNPVDILEEEERMDLEEISDDEFEEEKQAKFSKWFGIILLTYIISWWLINMLERCT